MLLDNLKKTLIQAAKSETTVTFCVWGKHGIGKTQSVEQVAKELGYGFRNFRASQIDPVEIIGHPVQKVKKHKHKDGTVEEIEYLDYAPPRWFLDALEGNYVIFLDELNRARKDVQQAVFELVQERSLNGRKLPDSVLIVTACNPPSAKYDTIEFDEALTDRFCHVLAVSNYDVFKNEFALKKNAKTNKQMVNPLILNFLEKDKSRQTFDFVDAEDNELPFNCTPSPRSWEKVDQIFSLDLPRSLKQELVSGIIGPKIAIDFFASIDEGNKPITLDEIFGMNEKDENDAVVSKVKMYSKIDVDLSESEEKEQIVEVALLSQTCDDLVRDDNVDLVKENYTKVLTFLSLVPADLAQKTLKRLVSKRQNKQFWESKLGELVKDSKGNPIEGKYVWDKLLNGLQDLAKARENLNPAMKR